MPNKKLKLNNTSGGSGADASKWNRYMTQDDNMGPKSCPKASKWHQHMMETEEDDKEQSSHGPTMAKGDSKQVTKAAGTSGGGEPKSCPKAVSVASKWLEYMTTTEEEDKEQRTHGITM